jgi:hypothetical protein
MNDEDVRIRAARAEQLLQDEVLSSAFMAQTEAILARLLQASLSDPTQCVAAVAAFQASQEFKDQLQSYITSGKSAGRNRIYVA